MGIMSFDRYRTQKKVENILGCLNFDEFYSLPHSTVESKIFSSSEVALLKSELKLDAYDFFYKGCVSLMEGLNNFNNSRYSWGIVKLYYCLFYFLRAELCVNNFALIRHKSIYFINLTLNNKLDSKGKSGKNRHNYANDHKCTINYFCDYFSTSDILQSNLIDGLNAYNWYMKKREQINYQERNFKEPDFPTFLEHIHTYINEIGMSALLELCVKDNYILTFQEEYAPLAIPIKRFLQTAKKLDENGVNYNKEILKVLYNPNLTHLYSFV